MEGSRFDALAKGLAGKRSRRGAGRTVVVTSVGLLLARLGRDDAAAACLKSGKKCDADNECCSKRCKGGKCECRDLWQTCKRSANCCSGKRACAEITFSGCGLPGKRCCVKLQELCTGDDCECCGTTFCAPNTKCFPGSDVCCTGRNGSCGEDCDCCGSLLCQTRPGCFGNRPRCCVPAGKMCQSDCECCGVLTCVSGACQ